jgi:hypothetical protein
MTDATKGTNMVRQSFVAPPMPAEYEKLARLDPMLKSIWEEAHNPKHEQNPNFCREQLWGATAQNSGQIGLKHLGAQHVGPDARVEALRTGEAWMVFCATINQVVPPCAHPADKIHKDQDGVEWTEISCTFQYPLDKGNRFEGKGFSGLVDRLNENAGGPKAPVLDLSKLPKDLLEPIFVVDDFTTASVLYRDLGFPERLATNKISQWYHNNAFYVCDKEAVLRTLAAGLTRETVTGPLAWKPVVMCFRNEPLEELLANVCVSFAVIDYKGRFAAAKFTTLQQFREEYQPVTMAEEVGIKDMPVEVLDSGLGEICRTHMSGLPVAYAWPSLLLAASAFIQARGKLRTNLFVGTIGPVNSGKSSAMELAAKLLGLTKNEWKKMHAGSFEGLSQDEDISKAAGANKLVWVDELVHLLQKAGIQSSTFANNLDSIFYNDVWTFIIAHGKKIDWDCRLSIGGGLPEDTFDDLFGAATIGGLYDRFLFGMCPTGFVGYKYRPLEDIEAVRQIPRRQPPPAAYDDLPKDWVQDNRDTTPALPANVAVDPSVWAVRDHWIDNLKISPRCAEIGLRAAFICAAFDGRETLYGDDLAPALALAQYQQRVRNVLKPNPGKDNVAIIQHKIWQHLITNAAEGQSVNRRDMFNRIRARDYDLGLVMKAINNLVINGDVEHKQMGRQWVLRLLNHRSAAQANQ